MAGGSSVDVYRDIQTLFDAGTATGLSDRQLLERFSSRRDGSAEAAFEAIVQRHGPMVLRICHKVLGNHADADEAFQATFLILVKKSHSIRKIDTVGGWLFGVAGRVAARARVERARRRSAEARGGLRIAAAMDSGGDGSSRLDLNPAVEAEVLRLPEKYRAVVVLCYWEGLTHEQAAARLGCPLGTVRSRIARARDLLHRRLSRRGLEPVAGAMAGAFDSPSALTGSITEIPKPLLSSTVQLAQQVGAGRSMAELASPSIASLVQTVVGSMFMTKLKTIAACVLIIGAGAYGLTMAAPQAERERQPLPDRGSGLESVRSKAQPPLIGLSDYVVEPPDVLKVEVLEALPGRPIHGEHQVGPDGKMSLGYYGEIQVAGLTLAEVKEKVIVRMQRYIRDDALGLEPLDFDGEPVIDPVTRKPKRIDPKDSDRVLVEVSKSRSKFYYLEGAFLIPGRTPITGKERVLDAIGIAGGLAPDADAEKAFLYRENPKGGPVQSLKIDIDQITVGDDLSTNYQILPGDRLVVRRRKGNLPRNEEAVMQPSATISLPAGDRALFNRRSDLSDDTAEGVSKQADAGASGPALQRLEKRMGEVERKLDLILEAIKRATAR